MATFLSSSLVACAIKQEKAIAQTEILIPLYSYPSWYNNHYIWQDIAAASMKVPITAIINPNNGPGNGAPNRDYVRGIRDLQKGNVNIIGYVATNYGKRNIKEVKADIDIYGKYFDIKGIFIDEAASGKEKLDYYQEVYQYIKGKPKFMTVILNQGTHPDEGYLNRPAGDNLVIFENYSHAWDKYEPQAYIQKYNAGKFSCLIHTVPDVETMKNHIDKAVVRNIKYIYVTDDSPNSPDKDPWNSLPSYWQEQVNYLQSLNQRTLESSGKRK